MINIISGISAVGIGISVTAMIIILSAINGLEGLVGTLSMTYDPDIKITAAKGKTFHETDLPSEKIKNLAGVEAYSNVIEEICIVKYKERFVHAIMKGVEPDYFNINHISDSLEDGEVLLYDEPHFFLMADIEVAAPLEMYVSRDVGHYEMLTLFAPIRNKKIQLRNNPFEQRTLFLSAVFKSHADDELKPVLVDLQLAQDSLLAYGDEISGAELKIKTGFNVATVQQEIEELIGEQFLVKNRVQQNEIIYKVSESEKFFVFIILSFVVFLTSFNILASLTMLVIDKKKDILVLRSMGADKKLIRNIFFREGMMINLMGVIGGLILGTGIVLIQYYFHLIPLNDSVIDFYPVELKFTDYIFILMMVLSIGTICAYVPVRYLVKKHFA